MSVELFLLGYVEFRVKAADVEGLFSLLQESQISPKVLKRVKKTGDIRFFLTRLAAHKLLEAAQKSGLSVSVVHEGGAPFLCRRLLRRPGLVLGILLGLFLLIASNLVLWEVRVSGNAQIGEEELLRELAAVGLSRGRFLPGMEPEEMALSLREEDMRITYVGINLVGTVAYVQIREAEESEAPTEKLPANLVARCDGVITLPLVYEGECLVHEGDVVRAGDLLAGGLIDTQNHGYRVTRAAGQVFARTVRTFRVFVPFSYEEKRATGRVEREASLLFFNSSQKLFKSTGNSITKCDIIEEIKWPVLRDGKRLPIGLALTTAAEYETVTLKRTAAEARALALSQLEQQLAAQSADCALLQTTTELSFDGDGLTLVCTVVCEEDIAAVSEFMLEELYGTGNHQSGTQ